MPSDGLKDRLEFGGDWVLGWWRRESHVKFRFWKKRVGGETAVLHVIQWHSHRGRGFLCVLNPFDFVNNY